MNRRKFGHDFPVDRMCVTFQKTRISTNTAVRKCHLARKHEWYNMKKNTLDDIRTVISILNCCIWTGLYRGSRFHADSKTMTPQHIFILTIPVTGFYRFNHRYFHFTSTKITAHQNGYAVQEKHCLLSLLHVESEFEFHWWQRSFCVCVVACRYRSLVTGSSLFERFLSCVCKQDSDVRKT